MVVVGPLSNPNSRAVLVTGPNCSGKTTAVEAALRETGWAGRTILADSRDKKEFFGHGMDQSRLRLGEVWDGPDPVILFEGTDRVLRLLLELANRVTPSRSLTILSTRMKPEDMKAALRARCEKAGKTFNAPYWTTEKLSYEGLRRYDNLINKGGRQADWTTMSATYAESAVLVSKIKAALEGGSI